MESEYPESLAAHVGFVVMEASAAEDTCGEILQLLARRTGESAYKWSRSGTQLIDALKDRAELSELCRESVRQLGKLLSLRNTATHGIWLYDGQHWMTLKRVIEGAKSEEEPSFEMSQWSEDGLRVLADGLRQVRRALDDEVSELMGLEK